MERDYIILMALRRNDLRERIEQLADKCRDDAAKHGVTIKDIKPYSRPVLL